MIKTDRIDAWTHILPKRYFAKLQGMGSASGRLKRWLTLTTLFDLDARFRVMDGFRSYRQFLTPSLPPIEDLAEGEAANDLAKLMNDELAELVANHPGRFAGWCGAVSLLDPDAAVKEIDRIAGMGSARPSLAASSSSSRTLLRYSIRASRSVYVCVGDSCRVFISHPLPVHQSPGIHGAHAPWGNQPEADPAAAHRRPA